MAYDQMAAELLCENEELKKQLDRTSSLLNSLDSLIREEFKKLVDKSDNAENEAFKYIYANQAIGLGKALGFLQGARVLAGV